MLKKLRPFAGPAVVLVVFCSALWLLHQELHRYRLHDFVDGLRQIPSRAVWSAVGLTLLNYLILICYDWLGIVYIGQSMSLAKVALASFLGYAVGNNFGTVLGGSTIRYRLYSTWGLSAVEIVKLVLILGLTFWIGLFAVAGVVFLVLPLQIPARLHLPFTTTEPLGVILSALAVAYLGLCAFYRKPVTLWRWQISPPPLGLSLLQYVVATFDLLVAAGVLYVLLPPMPGVGYVHVLAIYLLAVVAGLASQVPGGLGVLELVVLVLLAPSDPHLVIGSLLAYRAIYYLLPLSLGLTLLGGHELYLQQAHVKTAVHRLGQWAPMVAPGLIAFCVFLTGVLMLFSGATPGVTVRLHALHRFLPLSLVEISHFLSGVVGVLLLVLARGLYRRIDAAYWLTCLLLLIGIVVSLLKGFDYEEAIVLSLMLAVLAPAHPHFYRKAAFLTERFSPGWFIAVSIVLICTMWLMFFAYRHVEYRDEMWWQFARDANAPRSLRFLVGAVLSLLVVAAMHLLRPKHPLPHLPTPAEIDIAASIVGQSSRTSANLALLGDKYFLFNSDQTALLMYGVEGRSWISLGDPVGSEDAARELAWEFREKCDIAGGWPVFYQAKGDSLATYVEMGLTLIKIGEEARVPLAEFSMEGSSKRTLRHTNKHLQQHGCRFRIASQEETASLLPELAPISAAWLASKSTGEKGFSLGSFQEDYLRRFPLALVYREDRLIAFANLWCAADKSELSIDLMRHLPDAPSGVMDFLFLQIMLWGQQEGYGAFSLGMAPLSGVEAQRLAPLWNKIAALTYRHGEHFYNFQGLRQYKDKFAPTWEPVYLASPGGLALPVILTNVATLISGGVKHLLTK